MTVAPESRTGMRVAALSDLPDNAPFAVAAAGVDLVLVRRGADVSALHGRCAHRGVLLADGHVDGNLMVCGVHGWRYDVDTGVSPVNPSVALATFPVWVRNGEVYVDESAIAEFARANPQSHGDDGYQGKWVKPADSVEEPFNTQIHELATHGLSRVGHHGPAAAMGVSRAELPSWDSIQLVTAQLHRLPLLDEEPVCTKTVIGPQATRPLALDIPIFVSDMSFGALSEEAKTALAVGAELAGTGICSGEGGMLPEEQQANSRYFYELASGRFGWSFEHLSKVQAFHFKGGQGAKTGTGGHLPGTKVVGKIAEVRGWLRAPRRSLRRDSRTGPRWRSTETSPRRSATSRGNPGRLQAQCPKHRARPRRRTRDRSRLHHPRRPWRRNRLRAHDIP